MSISACFGATVFCLAALLVSASLGNPIGIIVNAGLMSYWFCRALEKVG